MTKEKPDVAAIPRPRPFQISRHAHLLAGRDERQRIFRPSLLVEIGGQKPAGFIEKQRVDSDGLSALEMLADDLVGQRIERTSFTINLSPVLRATGKDCRPILFAGWPIRPGAVLCTPSFLVDVFTSADQGPKQRC